MTWTIQNADNSWKERFALAKKYYEEHGDLEVPPKYIVNGIWLSKWINEQKLIREGKRKNKSLTDEQIQCLDSIGMRWGSKAEYQWNNQFNGAKEYFEQHGNLDMPFTYVSSFGKRTAIWLKRQKELYLNGELSKEQIDKLSSIGFIEKIESNDSWDILYSAIKEYYKEHGDILVPNSYVTDTGFPLGTSMANLRNSYRQGRKSGYLNEERIQLLNQMGMVWNVNRYRWERNYSLLSEYYQKHGNLDIPVDFTSEDGTNLYYIIANYKKTYRKGIIKEEQIEALEKIGIDWRTDKEIRWEHGYKNAKDYYEANGNLFIPVIYESEDGHRTGLWIRAQRKKYYTEKLSDKQKNLLKQIGIEETIIE